MANNTFIFKGPQYYKEEDKEYFWGRKEETESLLYMVKHNDFVVCYAESGEGKSSLINAGLTPRMRTENLFPVRIQFNDNDFAKTPTQKTLNDKNSDKEINFDEFVWDKIIYAINDAKTKEQYKTLLLLKTQDLTYNVSDKIDDVLKDSIWLKLRENELRLNSYHTLIPVLIFDQFEEIFTRSKDINWTDEFFKWLENLYKDEISDNIAIGSIPKKFKVLLSLRSDFVSELDYWSMRKYFIPSLKNNRYCLKALTKNSAKEIASKLDHIPENICLNDIINAAKIERIGNIDEVKDDLPCISALVLSLILTEFDKNDDKIIEKIETLNSERNDVSTDAKYSEDFLIFIINHVYEKALEKCGIYKDSQLRIKLEEALIDSNGRRRRVSLNDKELQYIPKEKLEKLEKERIINKIGNDVEISHDCLRKVIEIHNKNRIAKLEEENRKAEQARLKAIRQKDNVYLFIFLFSAFCVSYLYLYFHSYDIIVPYFAGKVGAASTSEAIKEVVFTSAFVLIPTILASYIYLNKWRKQYIHNISRIFVFLFFVYAVFVFKDLVFCPLKKYKSTYADSAVMTLIVPLLYFSIYQNKKIWHYIVYLIALIPVMLNAFCIWKIPFIWLIGYLFLISAFIIYSFTVYKMCLWKKILWSFSNIIVLFASVFFQLGYNPITIEHNNIIRNSIYTQNWSTIAVKSENNKLGVLSLSGDTVLPFIFEEEIIYNKQRVLRLNISKNKNIKNNNYGYFYTNDNNLYYISPPKFELKVNKYTNIGRTKTNNANPKESLKHVAALVFQELRDEIFRCCIKNERLSFNRIYNFHKLDSLNKINTIHTLLNLENNKNSLNDSLINNAYRTISSDLCLCTIKDRFIHNDINTIMTLFSIFSSCYFLEEENQCFNIKSFNYMIDFNKKSSFSIKDLLDNKSSAYSELLHIIAILDMSPNAEYVFDRLKEDNIKSNNMLLSLKKDLKELTIENYLRSLIKKLLKGESIKEANEEITNQIVGGLQKRFNAVDSLQKSMFLQNYLEAEFSYKQLSDMTLNIIPIIEEGFCVNHNGSLIDICRELTKINVCRWYGEGESYVERLEKADSIRINDSYKLIREIIHQKKINENNIETITNIINNSLNKVNRNIYQILN